MKRQISKYSFTSSAADQYFLREIERPSGEASLACMVSEGISILGANGVIENKAKNIAREFSFPDRYLSMM